MGSLTFETVYADSRFPKFKLAVDCGREILEVLKYFTYSILKPSYDHTRKSNENNTEYQQADWKIARPFEDDRVFPLETVEIQWHRTEQDSNIENAMIHYGPSANEFARSMNALAVTIAGDIYFRDGAYNPGSEEGRKLLAHELTHVSQFEEGRIQGQMDSSSLEAEAERSEETAVYDPDPVMTIAIQGQKFSFARSKTDYYADMVARGIQDTVAGQKRVMSEEAYLKLLIKYREWIHGGVW
jgi:hypothetical protein